MKTYFFTMTKTHRRTGEHTAKIVGVVQAAFEDEALKKAWDLAGSDTACGLEVVEIDLSAGCSFTMYKSMI